MSTLIARFVWTGILLLTLFIPISGEGNGGKPPFSPAIMKELAARTYETWEGVYTFREATVIRIEGLRDLHAITYRCEGHDGMLLDFAVLEEDGTLRFLQETHEEVKGVTPYVEGIDVFPQDGAAEIIVRWRHPGQGGHRTVEKYVYRETSIELVDQADFRGKHRGLKWVKSKR